MKKARGGFTLLEMAITTLLASIVLMSAWGLFENFLKICIRSEVELEITSSRGVSYSFLQEEIQRARTVEVITKVMEMHGREVPLLTMIYLDEETSRERRLKQIKDKNSFKFYYSAKGTDTLISESLGYIVAKKEDSLWYFQYLDGENETKVLGREDVPLVMKLGIKEKTER